MIDKKKIFYIIILSVILYLAFIIYSDSRDVLSAFEEFDWTLIPAVLSLVLLGYLIRAVRWDYYLKVLGIELERKTSYSVFFSGLSMSVTPGKSGELIKSFILKEKRGIAVSRSAPVVLVERLTDLTGMLAIIFSNDPR